MIYQMKTSFDNKNWYQLEWENVDFRTFEKATDKCKDIVELEKIINEIFPDSNLKFEFIGELKRISKQTTKTNVKRRRSN